VTPGAGKLSSASSTARASKFRPVGLVGAAAAASVVARPVVAAVPAFCAAAPDAAHHARSSFAEKLRGVVFDGAAPLGCSWARVVVVVVVVVIPLNFGRLM
jgi:hypothetical protein